MTIRIFSKKNNLYTDSPNWPSNQRTFSDFFITPDNKVVEAIHCLGQNPNGEIEDFVSLEYHDSRLFDVEPWTGFFDCNGKKIFLGDIIKLVCFDLDYEVIWRFDRFATKGLFELPEDDDGIYPINSSLDLSLNWSIVGNVHGVEYSD